jgi:competence protein ComEC
MDHMGGMLNIIQSIDVGVIYMPNVIHNKEYLDRIKDEARRRNIQVHYPQPGDTFTIGDADIKVLGPFDPSENDINNSSIVLRLEFGRHVFLFMGDAEKELENKIMDEWPYNEVKSKVLKVGHHGSDTSSSLDFLRAVSPDIAVISVGSRYNLPDDIVLENLTKANATVSVYNTNRNGNIEIITNGITLNVYTEGRIRRLLR